MKHRSLSLFLAFALGWARVCLADDGTQFPFRSIPQQVPAPSVDHADWSLSSIDAFVYHRLLSLKLTPAAEVSRHTYLRRVTFDLTGLPPTPSEVDAFINDPRSDADARAALVDRLLASPHFGERLARVWLDVVRYADTDGFAIDGERPTLWRYRDYVVRSYNEDKPFFKFVREQLAGDLVEDSPEGLVATGFYRLGPWEADNMTPEHRRQDFLNEMTSAIGSSFLGLTLGCARCHDHKFDPLPTADFYSLQGFLVAEDRGDRPADFLPVEEAPSLIRERKTLEEQLEKAKVAFAGVVKELQSKLADSLQKPADQITEDEIEEEFEKQNSKLSEEDSKKFFDGRKAVTQNIGQRYQPQAVSLKRLPESKTLASRVLKNGDPFDPGEVVSAGFLRSVPRWPSPIFQQAPEEIFPQESQRMRLAEWVSSEHNPLTYRVYVNRLWQLAFGQGIVATANDFGAAGSGVFHEELLDWLARDFLNQGAQTKPFLRQLVLSRAYRSSTYHPTAAEAAKIDPDNRSLWRGAYRRLDAEGVRDALLVVSGRLNMDRGGPGFFEVLPEGVETKYEFFDWPVSSEDERRRRSLYMFQRRNLVHPLMEVFDVADTNQPCERRRPSVTAPQVLTLLNGSIGQSAAVGLAARVREHSATDSQQQVRQLYYIALGRLPDATEADTCTAFLQSPTQPTDASAPSDRLVSLCLALLNSNEFLFLD